MVLPLGSLPQPGTGSRPTSDDLGRPAARPVGSLVADLDVPPLAVVVLRARVRPAQPVPSDGFERRGLDELLRRCGQGAATPVVPDDVGDGAGPSQDPFGELAVEPRPGRARGEVDRRRGEAMPSGVARAPGPCARGEVVPQLHREGGAEGPAARIASPVRAHEEVVDPRRRGGDGPVRTSDDGQGGLEGGAGGPGQFTAGVRRLAFDRELVADDPYLGWRLGHHGLEAPRSPVGAGVVDRRDQRFEPRGRTDVGRPRPRNLEHEERGPGGRRSGRCQTERPRGGRTAQRHVAPPPVGLAAGL